MASMDGKTIIHSKSITIEKVSIDIVSPTKKYNTAGKMRDANNVSIKMMEKPKGKLPLHMLIQIILVISVGIATDLTTFFIYIFMFCIILTCIFLDIGRKSNYS